MFYSYIFRSWSCKLPRGKLLCVGLGEMMECYNQSSWLFISQIITPKMSQKNFHIFFFLRRRWWNVSTIDLDFDDYSELMILFFECCCSFGALLPLTNKYSSSIRLWVFPQSIVDCLASSILIWCGILLEFTVLEKWRGWYMLLRINFHLSACTQIGPEWHGENTWVSLPPIITSVKLTYLAISTSRLTHLDSYRQFLKCIEITV